MFQQLLWASQTREGLVLGEIFLLWNQARFQRVAIQTLPFLETFHDVFLPKNCVRTWQVVFSKKKWLCKEGRRKLWASRGVTISGRSLFLEHPLLALASHPQRLSVSAPL